MNFFDKTGKMALGSRLRLLTTMITDDAQAIYKLYNVAFSPKWFPVFFLLTEEGERTITEIAVEIKHSQPSVTKIVKEMVKAGLVEDNIKSSDKRKNVVALTEKGKQFAEQLKIQYADVETAVEGLIAESNHNLWEAIAEWEFLLEKEPLLKRVQRQKRLRESMDIDIVDYEPKFKDAFRSLNEEWISAYFEMEESDYKALDHPDDYIISKGGQILVALYRGEAVGVCALIKMEDGAFDFEMAKMAVSPSLQGKHIGWRLGEAIVERAKSLGASKIYLESNTILKPAINLYHKLGFKKVVGVPTPYKRCNIQMELDLT